MKFLIVILLVEFALQEHIISIIINEERGRKTQFKFGNKTLYCYQDLEHPYTFFSHDNLNLPNSSIQVSESNFTFNFDDYNFNAYLMKDNWTEVSTNIKIENMHFYYGEHFSPFNPHLGLGFKIKDKRMSIVYNAYNQGIIKQLSFGISLKSKETTASNSFLYLGGIPEEIKNNKYNVSCAVENKFDTWGCNITSVHFLDIVYYGNEYLYFHTNYENSLYVSINFDNFFNEKIAIRNASKEEREMKVFTVFLNFGEFQIGIKKLIKIKYPNVFSLNSGTSLDNDIWIGSKNFFRKFVVLFDYESKRITFYSNNEMKINIIEKRINKGIFLIVLNTFILIFGMMLNIIQIFLRGHNFKLPKITRL